MTWPTSDVNTSNADAGTDNPATFRTDVLDLIGKFNQLRNHVSVFWQGILSRTTAAQVRADLGAQAIAPYLAGTTAGDGSAYTFSPTAAISEYVAHLSFWVKFHTTNGSVGPTFQISGVGSPPTLVRYDASGAIVPIAAGDLATDGVYRVTLMSPTQALVEGCGVAVKNAAGNLGVGNINPSDWGGVLPHVVELPGGVALATQSNANSAHMTSNCYYDGSAWRYKRAGIAGRIVLNPDGFSGMSVFTAPSGTPGALVTFTEVSNTQSNGLQRSVVPGGSALFGEYKCRAWLSFDGSGTPSIRGSGNVSSITDLGVGEYLINLTSPMPDVNYAVVATQGGSPGAGAVRVADDATPRTTSSFRIFTMNTTGGGFDGVNNSIAIFR